MHAQHKRPRHWAVELVDAWVAGQSPDPIMLRIPAIERGLSSAHARLFCLHIKYHATHTEDIEPLGEQMAAWVAKYRARRKV